MKESFVFSSNEKYPSCHSSTICEISNGDLLATWFAGTVEGAEDSVILGSRLLAGSNSWQSPSLWVDVAGHAAGNPRVFVGPDKAVWLLAPINYGHWCQEGTRLFLKKSYDGGYTWTDLELFIEEKGILGKNKPLQLLTDSNIWLIPTEYEKTWIGNFIRSEDSGKNWEIVGNIGEIENVRLHQPTVVELNNGNLLAYMRSWEGYIYQSYSYDKGKTWTSTKPTSLLNNNSGIDMVKLNFGNLVLVFNPFGLGESGKIIVDQSIKKANSGEYNVKNLCDADDLGTSRVTRNRIIENNNKKNDLYPQWGPRTRLSLAISTNEGKSWKTKINLENKKGEYSYPGIIQDSKGKIHIIYTYNRTHIKHVCLGKKEISDLIQ